MRYRYKSKWATDVPGVGTVREGDVVEVEDESLLPRFPEWWEEVDEIEPTPEVDDDEEED